MRCCEKGTTDYRLQEKIFLGKGSCDQGEEKNTFEIELEESVESEHITEKGKELPIKIRYGK